jgi:hypothetical protein
VPGVRAGSPVAPPGGTQGQIPRVSPGQRAPGSEALAAALTPLDFGEAPRIGVLGDPGGGKTRALEEIVRAYLSQSIGAVIVIDAKAERRFDSLPVSPPPAVRSSPADYAAHPPPPGTRVIVARAPLTDENDPEAWARFAVGLAERRWPSLTVNDELAQATAGMSFRKGTVMIPRTFVRGRTQGLAQAWGTTSPHDVPTVIYESTDEIWQFKTSGMALGILGRRNYLRGIDPEVIEHLAGYPLPPRDRGEFVRLVRGRPWDGKIYKFV